VRKAEAGIVCGGLAALARWADSLGIAGDFQLIGRRDHDYAIDSPPPIGEHSLLFAAGAGIALDLKDQSRLDDGQRLCAAITAGWTMAFNSFSLPPWKASTVR